MSGVNSADGFQKIRPVLGDVTNRVGKRRLLLISGNSGNKVGDGHAKHIDDKEGDSKFTHKICQGVESIVKEKCGIKSVVNDNDKGKRACVSPRPCTGINSLRENIISGISKIPTEVKDLNSLGSSNLKPLASESCAAAVEGNCNKDEGGFTSEVVQRDSLAEELVARVCRKNCKDIGNDNFTSGKHGSAECSRLPESQGSGSFKLEKCIGLKGSGSSNSSAGVDLIKACSCSFCLKAAYIWSDLHYQDIKGRIAALKKSQKEASIMVQRSCRDKGMDMHSQEHHHKSSKLEFDLMGQWKSLFLHMEDILVREGSQLESSLVALKDLRESRKTELEVVNGMMPLQKE